MQEIQKLRVSRIMLRVETFLHSAGGGTGWPWRFFLTLILLCRQSKASIRIKVYLLVIGVVRREGQHMLKLYLDVW